MASYAERYSAIWAAVGDGWDQMLENDPFEKSAEKELLEPDIAPETQLLDALHCLYAGDDVHGDEFLQRAIKHANRVEANDLWCANPVAEAGYPHNLAVVIRSRAYARWLLGEILDRSEMRRVGEYLTTWCLTKAIDHRRFHDSMTMCFYLEGIRAAMIACDLDYAAELLRTKHKFRWHHAVERDLWTRLISAYPEVTLDLRGELAEFFDRVRDPDFEEFELDRHGQKISTFINREILALETGIIRQMYVVNRSALDPVEPGAVIEAVAR
ncbi:MAG: hypothetical protein ACUVXJ_01270 [Phycisphaerae bacterium]